MGEKGIVARNCLPPEPRQRAVLVLRGGGASRQRAAGLRRETIAGNNPFLLHVVVHVLQGDKAKVPFPKFLLNHG